MHQQQALKLVFIPQTNSKCSDETTAKGLLAIASNWQSCLDCWFVVILWWNQCSARFENLRVVMTRANSGMKDWKAAGSQQTPKYLTEPHSTWCKKSATDLTNSTGTSFRAMRVPIQCGSCLHFNHSKPSFKLRHWFPSLKVVTSWI